MDVKRLEIFLKILETRSISKAAAAFGLAQPSVSASLKTLEDSIGHKLFERSPRLVSPLPEAFILEPYAKKALDALNEASWVLSCQSGGPKETLTVGASSVPSLFIMPKALASFKSCYPNVRIKFKTGESQSIIQRVVDGEIELAVVGLRQAAPALSATVIARDIPCLLATKAMAETIGNIPQSLEDLTYWPLIMREDGSGTKSAFLTAFNKRPDLISKLSIAAEAEGLLSILAMAKAGVGAAVISSLASSASWATDSMMVIPLNFMGVERNFYLIKGKTMTPAAKKFIKKIKHISEMENFV